MEILSDPTGAAHAKYNSDALQVTNAIRLVRLTICLHTLYLSIYPYRCVKGSHETGDSRVLVIPFQLHSSWLMVEGPVFSVYLERHVDPPSSLASS